MMGLSICMYLPHRAYDQVALCLVSTASETAPKHACMRGTILAISIVIAVAVHGMR
jgi:hypothetical protein